MTAKSFIITVDTEGDNLWKHREGDTITTRNAGFIPRFQELCDRYGFKPVYLTNYEMAMSDEFVGMARDWLADGRCEIGVHLHAWNNPPHYPLSGPYAGQSYLIEYPENVMRQKFDVIFNLLADRFGERPVSHRAGRWAMDERYFRILRDYGIKADCSVTPSISWTCSKGITAGGTDYTDAPTGIHTIDGVLEVPMTVRRTHLPISGSWKHRIKSILTGTAVWLRPAMETAHAMKWLIDTVDSEAGPDSYLEFMIHSSELMPGGSPYCPTPDDVDRFFDRMDRTFSHAFSLGYTGATLRDFASRHTPD